MNVSTPLKALLSLCVLLLLGACAPAVRPEPELPVLPADLSTFQALATPFQDDLATLGVTVRSYQAYLYEGTDTNAFVQATNRFYRSYPGFCPLENAFYAADNGLQFMTLAGANGLEVRGFLYDQSRRPRLTYAYFSGESAQPLPATVCETAVGE